MQKAIFLQKIAPYLTHNEIDKYCQFLKEYYTEKNFTNIIILQESRFRQNEKDFKKGKISKKDYDINLVNIKEALLHFADEIPDEHTNEINIPPYLLEKEIVTTPNLPVKGNFFIRFFKNIKSGDWNWYNIIMLGLALLGLYIAYISLRNSDAKPATENATKLIQKDTFQSAFPEKYLKDSLYVLITRFEDYIGKTETECVGRAISLRIKNLRDIEHLPIRAYYAENTLSPDGETEADRLRDLHHADLIVYGRLKNMKQDCGIGELCFKSEPSDSIIKAVGGQIKKNDMGYQKGMSPERIEMGEISIKGKRFDEWLTIAFFAKVGKNKPEWYVISDTLPKEELAHEYMTRGLLFYKNGKYEAAIQDFDKAIEINPKYEGAYSNRGLAKYHLNYDSLALQDINKAIEIDSNNHFAKSVKQELQIRLIEKKQISFKVKPIKKDISYFPIWELIMIFVCILSIVIVLKYK